MRRRTAPFKLTYATMFDPPEALHARFEQALQHVRANLGRDQAMWIDGRDRFVADKFEDHSPINTDWVLGTFQRGSRQDVADAVAAAQAAFPRWSGLPWRERVRQLRRAATVIERRAYEIAAVLSLEVGKNRMEALADVQETADLISYYCNRMQAEGGFVRAMGRDPLKGTRATNRSVLRPYGAWAVISPFNFPFALSGGPAGAALVAGNTVVFKPASDTPWSGRLLAECFRDADLPAGVFNYITGSGREAGEALITHPGLAGITFTGSAEVGMHILRSFAQAKTPRPVIAEMGGKNPAIVSRHADLERAAIGIVRSAFGLQGQKCSACSRVYVEQPVRDKLVDRLVDLTAKLVVGDPTRREVYLGPVVNRSAYESFKRYAEELSDAGRILHGGRPLVAGELGKGYFVEPTIVDDLPTEHRLWKHEMFLPITMLHAVESLEQAMALANDVDYGLTAGFYGSRREAEWFFDRIQAGVTYVNRPQGATTGAWPGYQSFGGWKGSGSTGKSAGGPYYLQQYLHEQSRTIID